MAIVRFVTIEGQRHELAATDPQLEMRCDGCGEFIAPGSASQINVQAMVRGANRPEIHADLHASCIAAKLAQVVELLRGPVE